MSDPIHPSHNYLPPELKRLNNGLEGCMECDAHTPDQFEEPCPASVDTGATAE